ncbi:MAG: hypothetical protein E7494_12610 [Ruminococcus albus]|nr:hypothetical protein [Ruminococcus albus]
MNEKNNINLADSASDELLERKKMQKAALIKMGAMLVLSAIMLIFSSIAWFTSNSENTVNGMKVTVKGSNYQIMVLDDGSDGQYYTNYHSYVQDPSAVVWQMKAANNMGNYNDTATNPGIKPGSYGMVSFYVKPLVDSVDLSFNFELLGYKYDKDAVNAADRMQLLDSDESPALFLNGHILLFEERTGETEDDFVYSKPILSNEDMQRVISKNTYTRKANDAPTQVDIYWVWPTTLSKVIDARGCTKISVTEEPFTNKTAYSEQSSTSAYSEVVDNIRAYPDYYCKGVSRPENANDRLDPNDIVKDYDKYGDYYDQADNDIGMGVNYILLKLSVSEVTSAGE